MKYTTRLLQAAQCGLLVFGLLSMARASTIGIISGEATVDGRPLLVKNRDNSANAFQEFVYNAVGPYRYISATYAGLLNEAYMGVNETGFGINNADAWNLPDTVPGPDDDGIIMDLALRTCQTVEDFQAVMDSTDISGRTLPTMYGVIDAFGGGAIFECAPHSHIRFDLSDSTTAPNGYMVRANFAYEGGVYHLGQHRHDRFLAILDSAYAVNCISHPFISMTIQQDLVNEELSPYPLPFDGRDGGLPYGCVHTHDAINRDITRSGAIIQGVDIGENPLLACVWAMVGEPIATISLPLWVHAGTVPVEFDSPDSSALNLKAQQFTNYLYQRSYTADAMDTWLLVDERGEGLLSFLDDLEIQACSAGDSALAVWRLQGIPMPAEVEAFQNSLASTALAAMEAWGPPQAPEITITWLAPDQVEISWEPITTDVFGRPLTVAGYTLSGSSSPFINRLRGDSLLTVSASPIIFTTTEAHRFFQVRCSP